MENPPAVSIRFRITEDNILQWKPYPSYPTWLTAWDVGETVPTDAQAQIDALDMRVDALELTDITLGTSIDLLNITVAAVSDTADGAAAAAAAAQATADSAAAAAAALTKTVDLFADSAVISGGTPTYVESTNYRYNYVRYTTVLNAQFEWKFSADLTGGATISVLYVSGTGSGTIDMFLDGNNIGSKDFSTGGANNHALWTLTISAAAYGSGQHTLRLRCGGAGSVGGAFAMSVTKAWISAI